MITSSFNSLFYFDTLSKIMMVLALSVTGIVAIFSRKYLAGDKLYRRFFVLLGLMAFSLMVMAASNHLAIFLASWGACNWLLVKLMVHKPNWQAAQASGRLAGKSFACGFICLLGGLFLLYFYTGETSIQSIIESMPEPSTELSIALTLITIAAMSQSAIWPFHRWLISSLNSPTPISALMHAGLVNGGGFLLARFAPLYLSQPQFLNVIFILGLASAILGTLWKLIQNDIKRMLACSTMAQMGFMMTQCGLGLFPAALAHMCWHGFFKANLFLSSGSAAQEKRIHSVEKISTITILLAVICGTVGSFTFSLASHKSWIALDTTLILIAVAFISVMQFALSFLNSEPLKKFPAAILFTALIGFVYGFSVDIFESALKPLQMMQPQPLNIYYMIGLIALASIWLIKMMANRIFKNKILIRLSPWFYVKALNASQPDQSTITTYRKQYQF